MIPILFLLGLATSASHGGEKVLAPGPKAEQLIQEFVEGKKADPALWHRHEVRLIEYYEQHGKVVKEWRKRSMPPKPDLRALNLPLAILVVEAYNGAKSGAEWEAIALTDDPRKVDVLLEAARADSQNYAAAMSAAEAISPERGALELRAELEKGRELAPWNLAYCLTDRLAEKFPEELRRTLYARLMPWWKKKSNGQDVKQLWALLIRLEPDEGGKTLVVWMEKHPNEAYEGIYLLWELKKPPANTVPFVLKQLKKKMSQSERSTHWQIILRADFEKGWPPFVEELDSRLKKIPVAPKGKAKDRAFDQAFDLEWIARIMMEFDDPRVSKQLAGWIFEKRILDSDRLHFLQYLVEKGHVDASPLIERWMKEEEEHTRKALKTFLDGRQRR